MTTGIEITGLVDLARLSRGLRAAGEQGKGLRREVNAALNRETKTTRKEMRNAIRPSLPQSGGLADQVLRNTRLTTSIATGKNPGVRIKVRSRSNIRSLNRSGTFRHPVFGNRSVWVNQSAGVEKGFLDKPFEDARPDLQRAVVSAIARANDLIYRSH